MIKIVEAKLTDIPVIQEIAYKTWPITFANILSKEQIEYMLNMMYSTESLSKQMKGNAPFILAKDGDNYLGFASYQHHYNESTNTRLHKIYMLPNAQGKGVGKFLINEIEKRALAVNDNAIELNVNRFNSAVNFYVKYGFEIIKEEDIAIGNGFLMEDFVMLKKLINSNI
jgi:diamine N-acetyltransferase